MLAPLNNLRATPYDQFTTGIPHVPASEIVHIRTWLYSNSLCAALRLEDLERPDEHLPVQALQLRASGVVARGYLIQCHYILLYARRAGPLVHRVCPVRDGLPQDDRLPLQLGVEPQGIALRD